MIMLSESSMSEMAAEMHNLRERVKRLWDAIDHAILDPDLPEPICVNLRNLLHTLEQEQPDVQGQDGIYPVEA